MIIGPYRFFFYSGDGVEPPHIHIEREDCIAKFWLNPVVLESSGGFTAREINKIHKLVESHEGELLDAWNNYFGE